VYIAAFRDRSFVADNRTTMKRTNLIYWISTILLAAQVAFAGVMYFTSAEIATGFTHLGFPSYFRAELGTAKLLAALLLVLPMVPLRVKEWAYAGLAIVFVSAFIAHASVDGASTGIAPVVSLVVLAVSYVYAHKRQASLSVA
jgi:hypothetical protein